MRATSAFLTLVLSVCVLLGLSGCAKDPVSSSSTNNSQFQVNFLFEHDGCKVFRFEDAGYYHYWAKCENKDSISEQQPAGKSTRPDSIDTNYTK